MGMIDFTNLSKLANELLTRPEGATVYECAEKAFNLGIDVPIPEGFSYERNDYETFSIILFNILWNEKHIKPRGIQDDHSFKIWVDQLSENGWGGSRRDSFCSVRWEILHKELPSIESVDL
jgi:hypothetical protein